MFLFYFLSPSLWQKEKVQLSYILLYQVRRIHLKCVWKQFGRIDSIPVVSIVRHRLFMSYQRP